MHVSGYTYNETTHYICNVGYEIDGKESAVCQLTGSWSVPPNCKAIFCQRPLTPPHARMVSITGTKFVQTALYECPPGYITDDAKYIICQLNGEWSSAPNCTFYEDDVKEVNCGPPPVVLNSQIYVSGHEHNDTADFICNDGYMIEGANTISCQNTGHWTVPPKCKAISCGWPKISEKAKLSFISGTKFGQRAYLECPPGYTTHDPKYIICQRNGIWSLAPNCTLYAEVSEDQAIKDTKSGADKTECTYLVVLISCTCTLLLACIIIIFILLRWSAQNKNRTNHNVTTVNNALYDEVIEDDSSPSLANICE
ncbi:P-selectin-like [Watersipora subatra]|uniref:P-selectin-like n=1 Tax=Watersipora subatra TaxID=2589382 RepID=UPI00355C3D07